MEARATRPDAGLTSVAAATYTKDLQSGSSIWSGMPVACARTQSLGKSIHADIVVVGAGISGAFMAHALSRRFGKIVMVDRRAPAQGSTLASTAMLQFEIDTSLVELRRKIGASKAARAWRRSYGATRSLISLVRHEGIECGLESRDSLYLAGDRIGSRGLKSEWKARRRIGLPGRYLDAAALYAEFGIERTGAILSPGSAVANPVQLANGLLRIAISKGLLIYAPVQIDDVLATKHGVVLDAGSHFIEARHCIFCTGYEALKTVPTRGTRISSSWAIATRPGTRSPRWLDRTLVWEASDPYLYIRTTPDGRLLVGGEDEAIDLPSYRTRNLARKSAVLAAKAEAMLPDTVVVPTRSWTGAFGESDDGLPIIDAVPGMPNCFTVMGFGGNGTIHSVIASQIVPTLIRGRPDKDADLYRFKDM
jgi:glycine/D-amino acid oxidase-like deaminating enzyme